MILPTKIARVPFVRCVVWNSKVGCLSSDSARRGVDIHALFEWLARRNGKASNIHLTTNLGKVVARQTLRDRRCSCPL
jgi:hypothetical protein